MSYVTPFDDFTRVDRELSIPALDLPDNFFPVDSVSDSNTSKNKRDGENVFTIKKNGALSILHTFKTWKTSKTSVNKLLRRVYPSATNNSHAYSFKTEYYVRNTVGEDNFDEPLVVMTQVYSTDGNPLTTGELQEKALLDHLAFVLSQGKSTDELDPTQLDRLNNGGAAPIGIR